MCDATDPDSDCTIDWGAALPRLLGLVQSVRQSHSVRPDRILLQLAGISEGANAAISTWGLQAKHTRGHMWPPLKWATALLRGTISIKNALW